MNSAQVIGRVGSLAVALGVGAAVFTGSGVAWATEDSDGGASTPSAAAPDSSDQTEADGEGTGGQDPDETDDDEAEAEAGEEEEEEADIDDAGVGTGADIETETETGTGDVEATDELPEGDTTTTAPAPRDDDVPAEPVRADARTEPKRAVLRPDAVVATAEPVESEPGRRQGLPQSAETVTEITDSTVLQQHSVSPAMMTTTVRTPEVPSWRPWPTAYDLRTVVTYVADLAGSFIKALLQPFAAKPSAPSANPTEWALLAWIRREFFNQRPTLIENPLPHTQSLTDDGDVIVTGAVGFEDRDGDPLTYTVVGRPLNGGVVQVDQQGDFVYRPMNAMPAVGGTDSFTVVVS
ncbi:MAG: glycoside hydrolase family 1 protein, partial [Dietzia sp.]|nr:glycoside hydrolase family 1 protein [Dietzia sp.]